MATVTEKLCKVLACRPEEVCQAAQLGERLAGLDPAVAIAILLLGRAGGMVTKPDPEPSAAPVRPDPAMPGPASSPAEGAGEDRNLSHMDLSGYEYTILRDAGLKTVDDVLDYPDLTEIKGIGPALAKEILAAARS